MTESTRKKYSKLNGVPSKGVSITQWIMFFVIAVFCFLFFCHQDVLITAGHAGEYLKGHITDFYSACYKTDELYGANYLPTTFVLFAIWNIPMKILGLLPDFMGDWTVAFAFWNKLLPTVFYFLSGYLLRKLVKERFDFSEKKSNFTMFLFFTTPMAFFSQFFFCQYDVFTVFFMIFAMYYYFKKEMNKKDWLKFILLFAVATTFKYFAFLIFAILLLLKEKNVIKDILFLILGLLPAGLEAMFYIFTDRKAFVKSVFDFSALDYTNGFTLSLGEVSVNGLYVVILVIIAFSYFTVPKSFEENVGYSMFYSCGICFALFGLMLWHPQWIMFIVPFWVISVVINKYNKVFLWLDALFGLVMIVYVSNQFEFTLNEQNFMRYGIFMNTLKYKQAPTLKLSDIFIYKDTTTLFSIICAILLIGFIFKHPKFNFKKINYEITSGRSIVNVRFLAFTIIFATASFLSFNNFAQRPDMLWKLNGGSSQETVVINNNTDIKEFAKFDDMKVEKVYIACDSRLKTDKNKEKEKSKIYVEISEVQGGKILAKGSAYAKNIKDNSHKFTKISLDKSFTPKKDTLYVLRFYSDSNVYITLEKNEAAKAQYYRTKQNDYSSSYCEYGNKKTEGKVQPIMQLVGKAK